MSPRKVSSRLLPLLRVGEALSGPEVARTMGVSRVAVWKAIQELRGRGVRIAASRNGYALLEPVDLLDPDDLAAALEGCAVGGSVVYRDSLGSTQALARALADEGSEDGLVVVAESQTEGRGRLGRHWVSDRGGLWFSVVLTPKASPDSLQAYSYIASLSVRDAIAELTASKPWLKWPNDVFVGARKVCGVLAEVAASVDEIRYVVLGIGVNVNNDVRRIDGGSYGVSSLKGVTGATVDRSDLLVGVLGAMGRLYARSKREGFGPIIEEYRASCATIGEAVRIVHSDALIEGRATGIDERGALEVESGGRTLKVHSGDVVHLRTSSDLGR